MQTFVISWSGRSGLHRIKKKDMLSCFSGTYDCFSEWIDANWYRDNSGNKKQLIAIGQNGLNIDNKYWI